MKRYMLLLVMAFVAGVSAFAMRYEDARREALYLTDKMAYELNLNALQYDYAYEINLDYLLSLNSRHDIGGMYYHHRCADLRDILHDWQYKIFLAADYFLRPVVWRHSTWYFPVYGHYDRAHFFFSHPRPYHHYKGGHGRIHHAKGFYAERRPRWESGLRGHYVITDRHHHNDGRSKGGKTIRGNGYSFQLPDNKDAHTTANLRKGDRTNAGRRSENVVISNRKEISVKSSNSQRMENGRTERPRTSSVQRNSERVTFKNSSTHTTVSRASGHTTRSASVSSPQHSVHRSSASSSRNSGDRHGQRSSRGGR